MNGIFGFSKKEVLWFTAFFLASISLMTFSVVRLISKYYNHTYYINSSIKKQSHNLWQVQDIALYAVNVQRGSLNLIIYSNKPKEFKTIKSGVEKNRDSLTNKLIELDFDSHLEKKLSLIIQQSGQDYLEKNKTFIRIAADSTKKEEAASYNVNTIRPVLRKFSDLTRETGKIITRNIQKTTEASINIFEQYEFWLLVIVSLPYFYFFFRFLALVIKMIFWDITLKE